MEYEGKLYRKLGKRYLPLILTSTDIDGLTEHCRDQIRWAEASKIECHGCEIEVARMDSWSLAHKEILDDFLRKKR